MTKIAAIQMCSTKNVDENLTTAERLIAEAAKNGAALCVLPEMFAIIEEPTSDKVMIQEKYKEGKIQFFLSEQAKRHNIWVVGGTIPIACDKSRKIRAACIVYDNHGEVAARYDKMHLFDVEISESESYKESDTTEPGNEIIVVDTPAGKLGLAVCFDIRFLDLFIKLRQKGAEIIAIPAAFTMKTGEAHWKLLTRARAIDTFCYVLGAAQGGKHENGRETYGHSITINPWGEISSELGGNQEGVAYIDIDIEKVQQVRKMIPTTF